MGYYTAYLHVINLIYQWKLVIIKITIQEYHDYLRCLLIFWGKSQKDNFIPLLPTLFIYAEQCRQFKLQSYSKIFLLTWYILTFILLF